jgi:ABC-type phosphate/phosphonate transport system substrate-binding protein
MKVSKYLQRKLLDVRGISRLIVADMKKKIFAVLAGAAIVATGCVSTVTDDNAFATTWSKDTVAGRYNRTVDQVYQASIAVIQQNGVMLTEKIPHDTTNTVRSLLGRVNDAKVYVRVEGIDAKTTQVDVQARTKWGVSDINIVHELEKEIALQLAR